MECPRALFLVPYFSYSMWTICILRPLYYLFCYLLMTPPLSIPVLTMVLLSILSTVSSLRFPLGSNQTNFLLTLVKPNAFSSVNLAILPFLHLLYAIDNFPISRVKSTKFLGVIVDEKLSWTEHISSVTKTISRNTGVLSKLRSFLPPPILFSIYNTLILPYINYCNIVWARSSTNHLHSLTLIQKRAIRICTLSYPRDHTAPLFARLGTLTVSDINKLHTGIFMYKLRSNKVTTIYDSKEVKGQKYLCI